MLARAPSLALLAAVTASTPAVARAQVAAEPAAPVVAAPAPREEPPVDPTFRKVVAERRAGVVLGLATGLAFAGASGYPNSALRIGDPAYYSESSLLVGSSTTIFLMGALTDWFSFGPMLNVASFENDTWRSTGFGIGFRA